jgi:RAB6A-GEF complex partner protein 1
MPWPRSDGTVASDWLGHETWILDRENFPWLQGEEGTFYSVFFPGYLNSLVGKVTLSKICHLKNSHLDGWITDDGHAYFVQYGQSSPDTAIPGETTNQATSDGIWLGSCIYPSDQRPTPLSHFDKALEIAINTAFSVIALGSEGGMLLCISFPQADGTHAPPTILRPPEAPLASNPGRVTALEWTSDGYALAVGWEFGWAIVSVGGRFLAWSSEATNYNPGSVGEPNDEPRLFIRNQITGPLHARCHQLGQSG